MRTWRATELRRRAGMAGALVAVDGPGEGGGRHDQACQRDRVQVPVRPLLNPRAARAASTSAGRFGPRSGARITAAARAASAAGSIMGHRRRGLAGDVLADSTRNGLAGDLPPGLFKGGHFEQCGEPGQVFWSGPGHWVRELAEQGHASDHPIPGPDVAAAGPRRAARTVRTCGPGRGGRRGLL